MHLLKILLLTILTPILLLGNTATPNGFAAGKKRALLIAIGDYPENGGWQKINSVNDLVVVKKALISQGFSESDIAVIKNVLNIIPPKEFI